MVLALRTWFVQHIATHCNTLQYIATHCNTLQHTSTHCSILQRTAAHCSTLQHAATHCNTTSGAQGLPRVPCSRCNNTLQHTATTHYNTVQQNKCCSRTPICSVRRTHAATTYCNNMLQYTATHCNKTGVAQELRHVPFQRCNTLQHTATHCNTLQHTTPHCNTLHRTAAHCNTPHHTAPHCNTPQHNLRCSRAPACLLLTLQQHAATYCNNTPQQDTAILCNRRRLRAPTCSLLTLQQHTATYCNNTLQQHNAIHYNTLQQAAL